MRPRASPAQLEGELAAAREGGLDLLGDDRTSAGEWQTRSSSTSTAADGQNTRPITESIGAGASRSRPSSKGSSRAAMTPWIESGMLVRARRSVAAQPPSASLDGPLLDEHLRAAPRRRTDFPQLARGCSPRPVRRPLPSREARSAGGPHRPSRAARERQDEAERLPVPRGRPRVEELRTRRTDDEDSRVPSLPTNLAEEIGEERLRRPVDVLRPRARRGPPGRAPRGMSPSMRRGGHGARPRRSRCRRSGPEATDPSSTSMPDDPRDVLARHRLGDGGAQPFEREVGGILVPDPGKRARYFREGRYVMPSP